MSDARAKELIDIGTRQFTKRLPMLGFLQEIAENFYVERADFMTEHYLGKDFAAHLQDSYPQLMRRELGNSISAMLRPRDRPWFRCTTLDDDMDADEENARFLEYLTRTIRRGIYDPRTQFIAASKIGDHDFVTFGQAVLTVEESPTRDHLFFRPHHLRDVVWLENEVGVVDTAHRNDKMQCRVMRRKFGDAKLHESVKRACEQEPGKEFPLRVVIMPTEEYDYLESAQGKREAKKAGKKLPWTIVYIDTENAKILKEGYLHTFPYVIPRWHRISGTQYAFSPATVIALPDARLAQQMGLILLEAGEKAVDPPMVATSEAVREVNLQSGAVSWVDMEYDERLGEALRPIKIDADMRTGFAMRQDFREMLTKAFFLDKLTLPPAEKADMTAYEVGRRMEEFVRSALPLFEPMEIEYNTQLLDKSFAYLRNMNRFDFSGMPDSMSDLDFSFKFESPIQAAANRTLVSQFGEVLQLVAAGSQAGAQEQPVNLEIALRDAIRGTSAPATWRKSRTEMEAERKQRAADAAAAKLAQEAATAANVAGQVGDAAGKLRDGLSIPDEAGNPVTLAQQMGAPRPRAGAGGVSARPVPLKKAA